MRASSCVLFLLAASASGCLDDGTDDPGAEDTDPTVTAEIFLGYVKNSSGATIGIRVADQNWGARIVKRHVLYRSGTGVADADHYHAILVR